MDQSLSGPGRGCRNRQPRGVASIAFVAVTCLASIVGAQERFDVQRLAPLPSQATNYFGLASARVLRHGQWEIGLFSHYADDPLVLSFSEEGYVPEGEDRVASIVDSQLTLELVAAAGFADILEMGVAVPFVLTQQGKRVTELPGIDAPQAGTTLGDIRLVPRALLYSDETDEHPYGFSLGLLTALYLPTGNEDDYQGEGFRFEPRLLLDVAFRGGTRLSANLGYQVRPEARLANVVVDDVVTYGLAASFPLVEWVSLVPELAGSASVLADEINAEELPLEALLGLKFLPMRGLLLQTGAGVGLVEGVGTPDWRVFLGISVQSPYHPDRDGDGLRDNVDACPTDPEDFDDFEDTDGCPDPDNDRDTIVDAEDACPNDPEDFDDFEDANGCPDPDNDNDGILDLVDACPLDAEDFDDFEDTDGCPDPDNDNDGILDLADACPIVPETRNGFEDEDGCPDELALVVPTCERLELRDSVYFDTDSDVIQVRSFELLNQVSGLLVARPEIRRVRIEGHTDDRGRDAYNLDLSERRAASVRDYLVARGVEEERLISEGYGESRPIVPNDSDENRARNRRVDFIILDQPECEE